MHRHIGHVQAARGMGSARIINEPDVASDRPERSTGRGGLGCCGAEGGNHVEVSRINLFDDPLVFGRDGGIVGRAGGGALRARHNTKTVKTLQGDPCLLSCELRYGRV